ncbi:MAG: trypsin-like serine protease [Pseudobdellovibrionaceae bacterium]|nr:trypsin-like serine protease [Pseudobdellovibrionaceae bacterium]
MISVVIPSFLLLAGTGCTDSSKNHLDVVNGTKTLKYPAVIQLTDGLGNCSGTFVRPNVILTSAHCDHGLPLKVVQLKTPSSRIVVHPGYAGDDSKDVALVFFDENASDEVLPLQFQQPVSGANVTVIGYGDTRFTEGFETDGSDGAKRIGSNTISNIDSGFIQIVGVAGAGIDPNVPVGLSSSLGSGDSGGPLLNESGEIIGVNANVIRNANNSVLTQAVMLSHVKDFIEAELSKPDNFKPAPFVENCLANKDNPSVKILLSQLTQDNSCRSLYLNTVDQQAFLLTGNGTSTFDVSVLGGMPWILRLGIVDYKLENLSELSKLKNLEALRLSGTGLKDTKDLARNFQLQTVVIEDSSDVSVEDLMVLPHITTIVLNGVQKPIENKLKLALLMQGEWNQACVPDTAVNGAYSKTRYTYESSTNTFEAILKLYASAECNENPVLSIKDVYSVKAFYPLDDASYALDLEQEKLYITVFNENPLPPEILDVIRSTCPYQIGAEALCSNPALNVVGPYTKVKFNDRTTFFATGDGGKYDGARERSRYQVFDETPFVRK